VNISDVYAIIGTSTTDMYIEYLSHIAESRDIALQWMMNMTDAFLSDTQYMTDEYGISLTESEKIAYVQDSIHTFMSLHDVPNIQAIYDTYTTNNISEQSRLGSEFQVRWLYQLKQHGVQIEAVEFPRYVPLRGTVGDVDVVTVESGKRFANELKAHDWSKVTNQTGQNLRKDFVQMKRNLDSYEPNQTMPMFDGVRLVYPATQSLPKGAQRTINRQLSTMRAQYPDRSIEVIFVD
jgi:hypothetical protein